MPMSEEVGTYQWIPAGDLAKWELDGWRPVARQSRFHFDSFLVFKPASGTDMDGSPARSAVEDLKSGHGEGIDGQACVLDAPILPPEFSSDSFPCEGSD